MTLKNRIILILCGVAVFFIAAPVIILLARGYYFDFKAFRLIGTGILTVKTDPEGAEIFLNGGPSKTAPAVLRLLAPGEYEVLLKKSGYRDWHKKVIVHERLVTSIPSKSGGEVALISQSLIQTAISTTTNDFQETDQGMFFSDGNGVFRLDITNGQKTLIATSTLELAVKNSQKNPRHLFRLEENVLWQNDQKIVTNLPFYKKGEIIASPDNQIYLLLDNDLYQVAENLTKINVGATYAYWNSEAGVLIYGGEHEIWIFNPSGKNELLTRSTKTLGLPVYHEKINYIFVSEGREIKAAEVDSSGQPNIYPLVETVNANIKLALSPEGTHLLYLDGKNLYTLKVR